MKTMEGHHTIVMDPWSPHSKLRKMDPKLSSLSSHQSQDRRCRLDTMHPCTFGDILGVPESLRFNITRYWNTGSALRDPWISSFTVMEAPNTGRVLYGSRKNKGHPEP